MQNIIFPIPVNTGGGHLPPNALLAMLIVIDFLLIFWVIIRVVIVRNSKCFSNQSFFKNIFFQLYEYEFIKPLLNFPSWGLIIINGMALVVFLSVQVFKLLENAN